MRTATGVKARRRLTPARRNGKQLPSGEGAVRQNTKTETFAKHFQPDRALLIGGDGIELEEFLSKPATHWVG